MVTLGPPPPESRISLAHRLNRRATKQWPGIW